MRRGRGERVLRISTTLEEPRIEEEEPLPRLKEEVAEADCLPPLNEEGFS